MQSGRASTRSVIKFAPSIAVPRPREPMMVAFDVSKTRIPTLNNINLTKKFIKKPVKTKFMEKIFKRLNLQI